MPIKLFTDQQKSSLAQEAGVSGPLNENSFNRDVTPNGKATMYMKLGGNQKFYGANPATVQLNPIQNQVLQMQDKYDNMPLDAAYSAYINSIPSSKQKIADDIGMNTGIYSELETITKQQQSMIQSMTGNQSAIFNATNPDGTPVDPRVKVAQYKANMASATDRVDQLRQLETVYKSQLKTLADAQYDVAQKESEKAKTALLYLKDISDEEQRQKDNYFKQQQIDNQQSQFGQKMGQDQSQFEQDQAYKYAALGKPELKQDTNGQYQWITPPASGQQMRTDRHSNPTAFTTDIARQAGLKEGTDYVTGDAFGKNGENHTAKLLGDPIDTTIRVIDKIGFKTQSGASRWAYTDKLGLDDAKWAKMDKAQKTEAIKGMYAQEGGDGSLFWEWKNKAGVTDTGVVGSLPKGQEQSYDDHLKEWGQKADQNASYTLKDAKDIVATINKQFPSKNSNDIAENLANVAPEKLKMALDADYLQGNLDKFDGDKAKINTQKYVDDLTNKYGNTDAVLKILVTWGFFDKYKSGYISDDDQYNIVQDSLGFSAGDLDKKIEEIKKNGKF